VATDEWEIYLVDEVRDWIDGLDLITHARVVQASICSPRLGQD